jgi:hypothetical protein
MRIGGSVTSGGTPLSGYSVRLTVVEPSGRRTVAADGVFTGLSFSVQYTGPESGVYAFTGVASKDGYSEGRSSMNAIC